ncbi:MAG: amidohydrolase family protein [Candidatus Tectomicrobia bacterium]|nr:amidohydrolase family protein [Candidatus Tectomicrobia bacterium]
MVRIIDMECNVPRPSTGAAETVAADDTSVSSGTPTLDPDSERPENYGMSNYRRIFRSRREGSDSPVMEMDAYVEMLGKLGIERAIPFGISNEQIAELLRIYPHRFLGLARMSCHQGMGSVRELERLVRQEGFHALGVSALVDGLPASDRRYYPLYTKAAELGIPVRIYSSMNYATDRPYDLGHPKHLDQVAMDFPELFIIGGLGGWPWVNEMVALVRRHGNLYVDTSAHRAKYFGQPGSGWEMLLQFGNTLIQDKVLVGISAGLVGQPYETLIEEYLALPLKDNVKEKWLYGNAARVFGLD